MSKQKTANNLVPGTLFHPGEYIKDELEARNLSQQQLAGLLQLSKSEVSLLVNGKRNISPAIAIKLEEALGISAEFWMNLQVKYEIDVLKNKYRETLHRLHLPAEKMEGMEDSIVNV